MTLLRNVILVIPACALVTACGGGGMASTPTPPPPPSYTKLADMTGDRTFQTVGVQTEFDQARGTLSQAQSTTGTAGIRLAYTAASDTYTVTAANGSSATFTPADLVPPGTAPQGVQVWFKQNSNGYDSFSLSSPKVGGTALSYLAIGGWGHADNSSPSITFRLAVGGSPTVSSDVPRSGSGTYSTVVEGSVFKGPTVYSLAGNSTANFNANFASHSVNTSLSLAGTNGSTGAPVVSFGTFSGTGTISGNEITGTLSGASASGLFSGQFFGPQALEMGYIWTLDAPEFDSFGYVAGRKQ